MKEYIILFSILFFVKLGYSQISIPDANFKAALIAEGVDTNNDGEIQEIEALVVTNLDVSNKNISSIEGIQYFSNLTFLSCSDNQITSIDFTNLINLVRLNISSNLLTLINISDLTNLTSINFDFNPIEIINANGASNLTSLTCDNCPDLTSVDVQNATSLATIHITFSLLSNLDVSNLTNLKTLSVDFSELNSLNLNNATNLEVISINETQLNLLDIGSNSKLKVIYADYSQLTSLNVENKPDLEVIYISGNQLISLNVKNNPKLTVIYTDNNLLTSLNIEDNPELGVIYASNNQLTTLDVSNLPNLEHIYCDNNQLESLFIKNGANEGITFYDNPNLTYICADDSQVSTIQSTIDSQGLNATVNSYCSFTPGGEVFAIEGTNTLDLNTDGCDASDPIYPNLKYHITNGTDSGTFIGGSNGEYSINVNEGSHTISPILTNSNYYTISPQSITVDFPIDTSPTTQGFCVTPNGEFNDISVEIIPLEPARPGFDIPYKIVYKNVGTTTLSGNLTFMYEDSLMDVVSFNPTETSQSTETITWSYTDLIPFEEREINIVMNINTPTDTPAVNGDDILTFSATTPLSADANPKNNTIFLRQTVVNSFDPNDKTCIQGDKVLPNMIGEYLNYMIRFENTGTANAINIVIKDVIDTDKFDISTFIPLKSSHNFVTKIREGNIIEFIFENIELPFDDANNDGYVTFKIKTLNTLTVNDIVENNAEIYFDFNLPIITNIAQTQFVNSLSVNSYNQESNLQLYPNPSNSFININAKNTIKAIKAIKLYDALGKLISSKSLINNNRTEFDLSKVNNGIYLLEIIFNNSKETHQIIKE